MKITKRKTGYTIKCTAGDYMMLDALLDTIPTDARRRVCKGMAKTALTRREREVGDASLLRVDVDAG